MDKNFWKNKKVFITGHTGFKGSWLTLSLIQMGAIIMGFSEKTHGKKTIYESCNIDQDIKSIQGNINDIDYLISSMQSFEPEIVFHLAAQPLVLHSYLNPIETYDVNVMGTLRVLEAIKNTKSIKASILITTDKCYENKELERGYHEDDRLGGHDPYSSSKACAEILIKSYRDSYHNELSSGISSARAGNVIGGGDFAKDRLITDMIESFITKKAIIIRKPNSIRPWQHVLDPLAGYMNLAQKMYVSNDHKYNGPWNFGPDAESAKTVEWIISHACDLWGDGATWNLANELTITPHETTELRLDSSKSKKLLDWEPKWGVDKALSETLKWYQMQTKETDMRSFTMQQISEYNSG